MKRAIWIAAAALAVALLLAPAASAEFGFKQLGLEVSGPQAGIVPAEATTTIVLNSTLDEGLEFPDGAVEDLEVEMPAGFAGTPSAAPRCPVARFLEVSEGRSLCPNSTAVGYIAVKAEFDPIEPGAAAYFHVPVFNLAPVPGKAAKLGFRVLAVPVTIDVGVRNEPPFNVYARLDNISQAASLYASRVTLWGIPAAASNDALRGSCLDVLTPGEADAPISKGKCPAGVGDAAFLAAPRSCEGPLEAGFWARAWNSGEIATGAASAPARSGCSKLGLAAEAAAAPSTERASSPSGLSFEMTIDDEGLRSTKEGAVAYSDIKRASVTLPPEMTLNPSQAEGLAVCTEAQAQAERSTYAFGEGCPAASKVGTVEVRTPLLPDTLLRGSLFIAEPYANPFGSLIALYLAIKDPALGVSVVVPARVYTDPASGQVTSVFGDPSAADPALRDLPQIPLESVRVSLREGARSPLVTPYACGEYEIATALTPWANPGAPLELSSPFAITSGPDGAPCPTGGLPPFRPDLLAGTTNNRAGSFSPFDLKLTRSDAEQEITHFSIKLPPGITGKLAGIPYCSDAAIEAAKARTGPHGGQEELDSPSCPAASEVGRSLAGSGVGTLLTYVPGKVYLAGPYHGSKLSIVAITAGVAGPFDLGTVVIREALEIDPETAEVFIDATGSDPIPHIIRGIPVHLRDIRAFVDRPDFVLNPTDCTPTSTASTVLGSGLDFVSEADDNPFTATSRFQAADCAALPFKPKLGLRLKGGTRRGAHPAFSAHLEMSGIGEAGIASAQVTLPRSEFIENAHFKTICTRVQFKEGAGNGANCPPGSIYGSAKAVTPILGEPLTGPVFLRSSEHQLPDLVVALHNSQVDFNLVGRVDSVKGGGLRNTFEAAPDAPVSSFDLYMAGGKKGLFVNSTNLCKRTYRAKALFVGQNGKRHAFKPAMRAVKCRKAKKRRRARHARAARISLARAAG